MGTTNVARVLNSLQSALLAFGQTQLMQDVADVQNKMGELSGPEKTVYNAEEFGGGVLIPAGYSGQGLGYWRISDSKLSNATSGVEHIIDPEVGALISAAFFGKAPIDYVNTGAIKSSVLVYADCLVEFEQTQCKTILKVLQDLVEKEQLGTKAQIDSAESIRIMQEVLRAEQAQFAYQEAVQIWDRVDQFLVEADKWGTNNNDADALKEIVKKHAAARPLVTPATPDQRFALHYAAQKMLAEFEPHMKAFVLKEGKCEDTYSSPAGRCTFSGEYTVFCTLGLYMFASGPYEVSCQGGD